MKLRQLAVAAGLAALLMAPAGADDWKSFTSKKDHFQVSSPLTLNEEKEKDGVRAYLGGEVPKQRFGILVLEGKARRSRYETLKFLQSQGMTGSKNLILKEIHQGNVAGLQFEGLAPTGEPMLGRIYTLPNRTLVALGLGFDMVANRRFAQSMRLLPGKN